MALQAPLRVAIIGCGGISASHAAGIGRHIDRIAVTALADISEQALKTRAAQLQAAGMSPRCFADFAVMLKRHADLFDAVIICLPHHLHAPAILAVAAAGRHILCEKPLCISLSEADAIAKAVERAGITYMSAHNQLFMPAVQEARRMIDAGQIGRVLYVRSQDCFRAGFRADQVTWRHKRATQGGGELIDTGYHPTYRMLHLAGSPVAAVRGTFGRYRQPIEGEDTALVQVRFASGAIGEICTSWAMGLAWGSHQIHVIGESGQIFGGGDTLYYLPDGFSEPAKRNLPRTDTFEAQAVHFAECLLEGKRPPHGVEEGRKVLEVILQATQSAEGWEGDLSDGGVSRSASTGPKRRKPAPRR